jgi:hypothetical protein
MVTFSSERERPVAVPVLERLSSRYLRSRVASLAPALSADDPIHVLNEDERRGLRRIQQGAVVRAAVAGAINAVLTGLAELYAARFLGHRPEHATLMQTVHYWGVFVVLAAIFAIAEIAYLYWDALRSVRMLSLVAGLELHRHENEGVASALARAALELPNPPDATLGVDPQREANKLQLAFASAVYKLKISVTNFVFRALVTRASGRAAARGFLAFTAVPINALWNALVCYSVLREARIRVMGPSAASEMLEAAVGEGEPSAALVRVMHQALGSAVVRTRELHPNHAALIRVFRDRFGSPGREVPQDDSRRFLAALRELEPSDRPAAVRVLVAAAVLDGRLVRAERRLLTEAYAAAGVPPRLEDVEALRKDFVRGKPLSRDAVRRTA